MFGVTALVQTKLPWYIVPVYPALAILVAFTVKQAVQSRQSIAFGGLVVTALITASMAPTAVVLLFAGLTLGAVAFCWKMKKDAWMPAAISMTAFLVSAGISTILPLYNQEQSPIARLAQADASTGSRDREPLIVFSDIPGPTASFYSHRPLVWAADIKELREAAAECPVERIMLRRKELPSLSQFLDVEVVESDGSVVYAKLKGRYRNPTLP